MNLRPYFQFNRRLSSALSERFARLHVAPNSLTTLALASGVVAGSFFSTGTRAGLLWGAFWLHVSFILDNCDGEVSRLRKAQSRFGKWYDMIGDLLVDQAVWIGLFFGAFGRGVDERLVPLVAAACAGSVLNFLMVIWERKTGHSTSIHTGPQKNPSRAKSSFFSILDTLSHNGDSIVLAWVMAAIGDPAFFLLTGAFFINVLWATRLAVNFRPLVLSSVQASPRPAVAVTLKIAAFLAGLYLLWDVSKAISWEELKSLLGGGQWGILFMLLVFPVGSAFHAIGLYYLFSPKTRKKLTFGRLFSVYLAGDALNKITPFVDIGGEPVKIILVYKKGLAPLDEAVTAICMSRIVFVLSEIVFVALGLAALAFLGTSREFVWIGAIGIAMSAVFLVILVTAQAKGVVSLIPKAARRLHADSFSEEKADEAWVRSERDLKNFYRDRRADFLKSVLWNEAGWIFFMFEVYFAFRAFGADIGWEKAFIVQSLLQAITTVSFFIPGNLGAQEGGLAYLVRQLGFSATHGFALSLLKRFRQFFWALAGPVFYLAYFRVRGHHRGVPLALHPPD